MYEYELKLHPIMLMQDIAEEFLSKCNGCLLAITILGALLCEVQAKTPCQWREVYKKFEYYTDVKGRMPHDYERDSEAIFAAIQLSLKHERTGNGRVGMENVLKH
jgi:hypothetical protein